MRKQLSAVGLAVAIAVVCLTPTYANAACGNNAVYVFDAYWCPQCKNTKALLSRYGIPYTSIEITGNRRAQAYMAEHFNTTAIPVTVIDDSFIIGFNENRIKQLLCVR